ncbi:MAG: helix-turn-helix transcriptional regulator [Opitutaceae bacterium]|nr:helix-turn-helix transcriptional regulator [Opitutaceae bacterium]
MQTSEPLLRSPHGFKRFFPDAVRPPGTGLHVRGLGIRELMPPGLVDRPEGTDDYLFMLFHDPALVGARAGAAALAAADTMMIWAPRQPQCYGHRTERYTHSWLHVSGARVGEILRTSGLRAGRPFGLAEVARFLQCLTGIHGELAFHVRPDPRIVGNLLENFAREAARQLREPPAERWVAEPLLAVMRKIDASLGSRIDLSELAEAAGMSVSTLSARFRRAFGLSPMAYLIQYRMRYAAHLLRDRNLHVREVAARVGYDDPFHFSKLFKKHCGTSPQGLRRRLDPPRPAPRRSRIA